MSNFTVKQVSLDGVEAIWSAHNVTMIPAKNSSEDFGKQQAPRDRIEFNVDGDMLASIDSGRVYIMNQHGATVASYNLSGPQR